MKFILFLEVLLIATLVIGTGLTSINLRQQYNDYLRMAQDIEEKVEIHKKAIESLTDKQNQGHRFTAGNAWQMAQLIVDGEVDMIDFPDHDLIYPDNTWFHGWLNANGYLVTD